MKNMIIVGVLALASVTSLAAQNGGGCVQVVMGSEQKNKGQVETTFSATQILDIDFAVVFTPGAVKRFSGDHVVEFRVFTPSGSLYQTIPVSFSSDESKKGKETRVFGLPYPVKLQTPKTKSVNNQPHLAISGRIPVAGTPIINNSLYGLWRVEAFIDGETMPCAGSAAFTITP